MQTWKSSKTSFFISILSTTNKNNDDAANDGMQRMHFRLDHTRA